MRERGIGNLPFIAVLVLLVLAVALFFMARSEADDFEAKYRNEQSRTSDQQKKLIDARNAYDAMLGITGLSAPALNRNEDTYPNPEDITNTARNYMMDAVKDIKAKSEAKVTVGTFQVQANGDIKVVAGEPTVVELYGSSFAKETITFVGMITPLASQFQWAAQAVEKNNELLVAKEKDYQTRMSEYNTKINQIQGAYNTDVQAKGQLYDNEKQKADGLSDQVNSLQAQNDKLQADNSDIKTRSAKEKRQMEIKVSALENRIVGLKEEKEIALKEDPKDGEVLYSDQKAGLVFVNRGRNYHVSRGMKFTVWRTGKGGIRENIAVIRVIEVDATSSKCNILEWINPRVPIAEGMNISNPFYDPYKQLTVYIYGNLRNYPSDIAKRRLAESGCKVADKLDESVDVIVLGDPPVSVSAEEVEGEEDVAAIERKVAVERDKRLREIKEIAVSIGAVVVTEDVLRTFISY